jgi:chromosome segregation ATPase
LLVRRSTELQQLTIRLSEQTEERAREAAVWAGQVGALVEERDRLVREVTRLGRGDAHAAAAQECLLECADEIARTLQRVQEQGARAREVVGQLHADKAATYASLQQCRLEHQGVNTQVAEHISGMDALAIALEALLAETRTALSAAAQRDRAMCARDFVGSRQEPGVSVPGAAGHGDREELAQLRDQLRMAQDRLEVPPSST